MRIAILIFINFFLVASAVDTVEKKYACGMQLYSSASKSMGRSVAANLYYPSELGSKVRPPYGTRISPPVSKNAAFANTTIKLPLVIVSHGLGGNREMQSWLTVELAKAGNIVAAVDHFGSTDNFYQPHIALQSWLRPKDISGLLDSILGDEKWRHIIDTNKVFFAGFSQGGFTGLQLAGAIADQFEIPNTKSCRPVDKAFSAKQADIEKVKAFEASMHASYIDERIKKFFLMAPVQTYFFSNSSLAKVEELIHIVIGDNDKYTASLEGIKACAAAIPSCKLKVFKGGATHYAFRNSVKLEAANTKGIINHHAYEKDPNYDRDAVHAETIKIALEFFKTAPTKEMKGTSSL